MAWPWYTITSIESHKTWGGAWTRIPYIMCACVDGVAWRSPISMWTGKKRKWCDSKPACIKMSWGLCALGPPTKVVCHLPKKKYKRADLAGGERFWAGTSTVLQYDIMGWPLCSFPCAFLGLGSWLLTVTWIETLILTLIHPSLYINSHTSIFISYLYLYLNI